MKIFDELFDETEIVKKKITSTINMISSTEKVIAKPNTNINTTTTTMATPIAVNVDMNVNRNITEIIENLSEIKIWIVIIAIIIVKIVIIKMFKLCKRMYHIHNMKIIARHNRISPEISPQI